MTKKTTQYLQFTERTGTNGKLRSTFGIAIVDAFQPDTDYTLTHRNDTDGNYIENRSTIHWVPSLNGVGGAYVGADYTRYTVRIPKGETALTIARKMGNKDVIKFARNLAKPATVK